MSVVKTTLFKFWFPALAAVIMAACSVHAAGRFVASLDTPPSYISPYEEAPDQLSVALYPKSYPLLSFRLRRRPRLIRESFEHNSLTFNTDYYKHGRLKKELTPVSVDADDFLAYRIRKNTDEKFYKLTTRAITDPDKEKRRGGLGISVALPKRLDRIFGEGGAGLKVSGYRKITFSGRSQWTDAANTDTYRKSKFPSLNMEQISQFEIAGNIGSKITVKVQQDSKTDIPLANRIQIRYKGDDDDILKTIEAGNTTLNLPNTRFVGYSSRIRGLFGIKTEAQVGSLKLTAIASQEKGSSEKSVVTPTGEESATIIRDYEFAEGRIFDLALGGDLEHYDSVVNLIVYEQENRDDNALAYPAMLAVDPDHPNAYLSENIQVLRVAEVDPTIYEFVNDPLRGLHYVHFNSPRGVYKALGIWMQIKIASTGDTITVGDLSGDTLVLKLLRHNVPVNTQKSWHLMWRNCYSIPRGVSVGDLGVRILKGRTGTEKTTNPVDYQKTEGQTQSYLEILGLDQFNTADQRFPDGKMDDRQDIFREDWGLLIFPEREPFNSSHRFQDSTGNVTMKLDVKVPDIYEYTDRQKTDASEYFIRLATRSRSSIIRLQRANIIEGSERVVVNGQTLTRDTDYRIDYSFGQITLLSAKATDPNANVSIEFEYAPFLAIQKKTLLGFRAEYEWSSDFRFGTTLLYKSDKAQERKPRVGQETAKSYVYDFDASLKLRPQFLTAAANALPLVETEAASNLSVSGEIAQSRPNPNVDGVAYVDDFESAVDHLSLGSSRTLWQLSSRPGQVDAGYVSGKLLWHTPRDLVRVDDVYDRDVAQGQGTIRTFRMIFRPKVADTTWTEEGTREITPLLGYNSWAGIMRYFHARVDSKRAQLFEVRMRGTDRGKLHFDFGRISEDANGDGVPNSEDNPPYGDNNGAVDENEDTGVDQIPDPMEDQYSGANPDPNGDNWYFLGEGKCPLPSGECNDIDWEDDSIRYEWLNGTEGNLKDISVLGRPDKEALSANGWQTTNAYFSYVIDLADDTRFLVEGSRKDDWRTYRIPIRDTLALDTTFTTDAAVKPDWSQVTHVRIWFESADNQIEWDTVEVANWYFVQSNWQDSVISPPGTLEEDRANLVVASVSQEDGTFDPPPGVTAYKDPTSNVTETQRGLLMKFENLCHLDTCLATKELLSVDRYSGYRNLEMYVYGGAGIAEGRIRFFFRIGDDADNFYEYRTFVYEGWDSRNFVRFDFNDITALKDSLIRSAPKSEQGNIDDTSAVYRVKGRPNLAQVGYFAAGIVNTDSTERYDGEIWLDELRITGVRKDIGTAGRISVGGNIADLFTYNFNLQSQDPYFRGISAATRGGSDNNLGSGKTATSYNYSLSMKLDRFLPRSWKASLPVTYSYSKSTTTPLLRTNSDIVLPDEIRQQERTISESRSVTVSESFAYKGKNLLFRLLLNRLNSKLSYRRNSTQSVNIPYSFGENTSVGSSFNLGIAGIPRLPIFFWTKPIPLLRRTSESKLGLYPGKFQVSGDFSRNVSITEDPNQNRRSSISRDFNGRLDLQYNVFENLSTSLNLTTRRDLSDLDEVDLSLSRLKLGLETRYSQSFSVGYDPKLLGWLTNQWSYKVTYGDNYDRSSESRKSTLNRSWGVKGTFDHIAFLGGKASSSERHFQGKRRNVRGGGEKKKESGRPFYDPPLAVLRFLTKWIKSPSYGYNESFKASVPGMDNRPSWKYRLGFADEPDVGKIAQNRSPSSNEGIAFNVGSGFTLFGGLGTDIGFKRSLSHDLEKQGHRFEQVSTSWPELNIRIGKFRSLPLINSLVNKLIDVFSPRTSFQRSTKETIDLDGGFTTARSVSTNHNPLLSVNFKLLRKLSLTGAYNLTKSESEKFNPSDGEPQSITRSNQKSVSVSSKYSFSAPGGIGIPLFGKLKFRSTMSITVNLKINSSLSETASGGKPFAVSTDKSEFSWSTQIAYTFSQQIKGGVSIRWQDSNDNYRNRKSHVRELQLFTEIRF